MIEEQKVKQERLRTGQLTPREKREALQKILKEKKQNSSIFAIENTKTEDIK